MFQQCFPLLEYFALRASFPIYGFDIDRVIGNLEIEI